MVEPPLAEGVTIPANAPSQCFCAVKWESALAQKVFDGIAFLIISIVEEVRLKNSGVIALIADWPGVAV